MIRMVINNNVNNTIELDVANNPISRMKGLMFKKNITKGLVITPCNSIHTFWMFRSIDVIYINKKGVVVKIVQDMKPWRIGPIVFKAFAVIEFSTGFINNKNIKINDIITFKKE